MTVRLFLREQTACGTMCRVWACLSPTQFDWIGPTMTTMPASESGEKQASSRAEKRGTANAPYKPLKMTTTQKRRAMKKNIRK